MLKKIDLKKHTSIHIGDIHDIKIIDTIDDYSNYKIIGKGNNLLISHTPPPLAMLSEKFDYIKQEDDKLIVGAATSSGKLLSYARKNNLADFEFMAKLPGNIGGLAKMNAGLKEWEIFNYIHSIKTQDGIFLKEEIPYSYRHTDIEGIIYEITFNVTKGYDKEKQKLFNKMRDNQPQDPSAGSCFKNPSNNSAGYLIEQAGLKGYKIGDMAFSQVHANFLVNLGNGTYDEAIELINLAKSEVKKKFDIELELEIEIL